VTYATGEAPAVGDVVLVNEKGHVLFGASFKVKYPVGNTVRLHAGENEAVLWPVSIFTLLRRAEKGDSQ